MQKQKIIFLYGFKGNRKNAKVTKNFFIDYEVLVFNYDSSLKQEIEEIAFELKKFIDSSTSKKEKINLIGISAGGVIASYYQKFVNPKKVNRLATICSPLNGVKIPKFYIQDKKGLAQLEKNCSFLKKLNSKKSKNVINFYSPYDIIVPGESGKGENPVITDNFAHPLVHRDKKILNEIKEFFEKGGEGK